MTKEQALQKFHEQGLNWSSVSSFTYQDTPEQKDQWFRQYILGERSSSPEMFFGSMIDKRIQTDPTFMPDLPRYELMQYKMKVNFNGLLLFGTPDGIDGINTKSKK